MKYWINTVSLDHVQRGIAGGFIQANHGKAQGLKKLAKGDWMIFYSPKTAYLDGEPLQAFTALCQVTDEEPYQATMTPDFHPFRRAVTFVECRQSPIKPLLESLNFIEDKVHWGYKFRFGLFEIGEVDFLTIRNTMLEQM